MPTRRSRQHTPTDVRYRRAGLRADAPRRVQRWRSSSTECGDDEVIIAVRGNAGTVIDGLQIRCATLDTIGRPEAYELEPTP